MLPKPSFLVDSPDFCLNSDDHVPQHYERPTFPTPQKQQFSHQKNDSNKHRKMPNAMFKFNGGESNNHRHAEKHSGLIRCNHNGCRFSADAKTIQFHKKVQHFELKNKYRVNYELNTEEDVEKWKAERRQRFPTLNNVVNVNANLNSQQQAFKQRPQNKKKRNKNHVKREPKKKCNASPILCLDEPKIESSKIPSCPTSPVPNEQVNPTEVQNSQVASLSLLSCYSSDAEEDDGPIEMSNHVSQLSPQIDQSQVDSSSNDIEQTIKHKPKVVKRKLAPKQSKLVLSKLNIFQRMMLQDVDNVRDVMLNTLKLIAENNFLN